MVEKVEGLGGPEVTSEMALKAEGVGDDLKGAEGTGVVGGRRKEDSEKVVEKEEDEPDFLRLEDVPDELKPHYKRIQRGLTEKIKEIAAERSKIDLVNAMDKDPEGTLRGLARQFGFQLKKEGEESSFVEAGTDDGTIAEVIKRTVKEVVSKELEPLKAKVSQGETDAASRHLDAMIEYLNDEFPDWIEIETEMVKVIQENPSLARSKKGVKQAYSLAYEDKHGRWPSKTKAPVEGAKVGRKSQTKTEKRAPAKTFSEAFAMAKTDLEGGP